MTAAPRAVETFPTLDAVPCVRAAFLTRMCDVEVNVDRDAALATLRPRHDAQLDAMTFPPRAYAEQVHGTKVALISTSSALPAKSADALATNTPGVTLAIYVADCAAVYLVDPLQRAIALVHSGRKGTEGNILAATVQTLVDHFGSNPRDLVAALSPCIRPPHYEVDFAAAIAAQARECGIESFHDAGICTASHPERYYSYRREMGRTGRMLAALALRE